MIHAYRMPGSDGYEICDNVRVHAKNKKLPILFMTARLDNARLVESLGAGGDSCIGKPFEKTLRAKLDKKDQFHDRAARSAAEVNFYLLSL